MSPSEQADLQQRWRTLEFPPGERLNAERVHDWAGGPVLVAVDAGGTRHLLVRLDGGTRIKTPQPVAGLTVKVRELHPPGEAKTGTWLDLCSGQEPEGSRPFAGLCADILNDLPAAGSPDPQAALAVIARWRRFWSTTRHGLSHEEQLGLFGELWLLLDWVRPLTLSALDAWRGPLGGRHDFVTDRVSVEVKTTGRSSGPVVHRINGLSQLDMPVEGELYLLSIQAVADPLGEHSLDDLIDTARTTAHEVGPVAAGALNDRLAAVGWHPQDVGRYEEKWQVRSQELFRIDEAFPRLTPQSFPSGLPPGIVDVSYTLDASTCRRWRAATSPSDSGPLASLGS